MPIASLLFAASVFFFGAAGFFTLVFVAIFVRPRVFMILSAIVSAVVFLFDPVGAMWIFLFLSCACLLCHCHKALTSL